MTSPALQALAALVAVDIAVQLRMSWLERRALARLRVTIEAAELLRQTPRRHLRVVRDDR